MLVADASVSVAVCVPFGDPVLPAARGGVRGRGPRFGSALQRAVRCTQARDDGGSLWWHAIGGFSERYLRRSVGDAVQTVGQSCRSRCCPTCSGRVRAEGVARSARKLGALCDEWRRPWLWTLTPRARLRSAGEVRDFVELVRNGLKGLHACGAIAGASVVIEGTGRLGEPSREPCPLCAGAAGPLRGCRWCAGGMLSCAHIHAHVLVVAPPHAYGDDVATRLAWGKVAAALARAGAPVPLDGNLGGKPLSAWFSGAGVRVDKIDTPAGVASYMSKAVSRYMAKADTEVEDEDGLVLTWAWLRLAGVTRTAWTLGGARRRVGDAVSKATGGAAEVWADGAELDGAQLVRVPLADVGRWSERERTDEVVEADGPGPRVIVGVREAVARDSYTQLVFGSFPWADELAVVDRLAPILCLLYATKVATRVERVQRCRPLRGPLGVRRWRRVSTLDPLRRAAQAWCRWDGVQRRYAVARAYDGEQGGTALRGPCARWEVEVGGRARLMRGGQLLDHVRWGAALRSAFSRGVLLFEALRLVTSNRDHLPRWVARLVRRVESALDGLDALG